MHETIQSDESYGDNFILVIPGAYAYHTKEHPFCWDSACPCHTDKTAIALVDEQVQSGLLTHEEAIRTIAGKML